MSDSIEKESTIPIFEVHRVGNLSKERAASISLADASRAYTELVPITSLDQLQNASAVATVPPVGMSFLPVIAGVNEFLD